MKRLLYILFFITLQQATAQTEATNQLWTDYNPSYFFSKKSALLGNFAYRTQFNSIPWHQIVIRPGYNHLVNSTFSFNTGLGYFNTFGEKGENQHEFRFYQGLKLRFPDFVFIDFNHYLRLEERIITSANSLRFRYKLTSNIFITNTGKSRLSVPISAEAFFAKANNTDNKLSKERVRFYCGVAYQKSNDWKIEFRYNIQGAGELSNDFEKTNTMYRIRFFHYIRKSSYYSGQTKK